MAIVVTAWSARLPPDPVPVDAVSSRHGWADEASCIDCHRQAEAFAQTGHAQTLMRATHPTSRALLASLAADTQVRAEQTQIDASPDAVVVRTSDGLTTTRVELDWCFGSGMHARTWTSILPDSTGASDLLEFRWSWYHGNVIDVTPGQPRQASQGHYGKLGVLFDGPKAFRCFACHSSYLPERSGAIPEEQLVPGIGCQRCHGPRQQHVDSDGDYSDPAWRAADRMDAVNRCGQCHRRADELRAEELTTDNTAIVRFQPVGLVQSACFVGSEMTCTTCHNPHTPASQQDMRGIWQCVQCHSPEHPQHVLCGAGEADDCLMCHMPAVQMDAPVRFTDHWIRIRDPELIP